MSSYLCVSSAADTGFSQLVMPEFISIIPSSVVNLKGLYSFWPATLGICVSHSKFWLQISNGIGKGTYQCGN